MHRRARLALAVVMVGVTAVCFAGVAAAGEKLSRKQFLKAANATCKEMYKAIDTTLEAEFAGLADGAQPSPAQIQAGIASVVEILQQAATDLEAMQGPAGLERKVDTFLDRFNAVVDEFAADPEAAYEEELSGYPFAVPDKYARRIGLRECVQRG